MIDKLEFVTLNTRDSQVIPRDFVTKETFRLLLRPVRRGGGSTYIFDFIVTRLLDGCAVFTVLVEGSTISQGTVCWKESVAERAFDRAMESWAMVNGLYAHNQSAPIRQRPQSPAWMCVTLVEFEIERLTDDGRLNSRDLSILGSFHSCLGWTIIKAFQQGW